MDRRVWEQSRISFKNGNYGYAALHVGMGTAYGLMNLATLGEAGAVVSAGRVLLGKELAAGVAAKEAEKNIYVIGRQVDTSVAKDWVGHTVLDIKNWTLAKNDAFMEKIFSEKATLYLGSPQTRANLWDAANNRMTVFGRELEQAAAAGYRKVGDYMVPGRRQ